MYRSIALLVVAYFFFMFSWREPSLFIYLIIYVKFSSEGWLHSKHELLCQMQQLNFKYQFAFSLS